MRLLPQDGPAPRLLNSVVSEPGQSKLPDVASDVRSRLIGPSIFSGNGRAIFLGIVLGAAVLSMIGFVYSRHRASIQYEEARLKLLAVSTESLSVSRHVQVPPAPILVQVRADLLHVTAISLGHPRLAIINGQQVAEGELVTVHTPSAFVALTLKVLTIGDGRIDLTDGTQVITARLELPGPAHSRP
ncbi:MAG: hypothetical protein V7609_2827 [Verrucomicrobiota bacterium]